MRRSLKSVIGVTLLEIMLVLAIAAMIIVMSIRYYSAASLNQKVSVAADNITGIIAAGESVLSQQGTLSTFTSTMAAPFLPNGAMPTSPWGGTMTIVAGSAANTYTITLLNIPANACTALSGLVSSPKISVASGCSSFIITE